MSFRSTKQYTPLLVDIGKSKQLKSRLTRSATPRTNEDISKLFRHQVDTNYDNTFHSQNLCLDGMEVNTGSGTFGFNSPGIYASSSDGMNFNTGTVNLASMITTTGTNTTTAATYLSAADVLKKK